MLKTHTILPADLVHTSSYRSETTLNESPEIPAYRMFYSLRFLSVRIQIFVCLERQGSFFSLTRKLLAQSAGRCRCLCISYVRYTACSSL